MLDRAQKQSSFYAEKVTMRSASTSGNTALHKDAGEKYSMRISKDQKQQKCYFCGGNLHPGGRNSRPAKDKICNNCGKEGHFQRVCQSKLRNSAMVTIENKREGNIDSPPEAGSLLLLSIAAGAPSCVSPTVLPAKLNGLPVKSLLDTGASESFVNEEIAKNAKLVLQGRPSRVSMASDNLSAPVIGKVCSNLLLQGRDYPNVTFSVMSGLCADVVLGQDFLRQHKKVVIKLGGPKKSLLVGKASTCGVAASEVKCNRLFRNLKPECRPIATKSRKFNEDDKRFIDAEVRKLLLEGIIEPSYSPWRAQVLVARDERHKPRMVVDYSQTVNRFTLLDAYPLPNIDEQIAEIAKASVFSTLD